MGTCPYDQDIRLFFDDGLEVFKLQVMPLFSPPVGENLIASDNEVRGISPAINNHPTKRITINYYHLVTSSS